VIAAVLVVIGVGGGWYAWWHGPTPAIMSLPVIGLFGVIFLITLMIMARRSVVRVWLDDAGLRVSGQGRRVRAAWTEVTQMGVAGDRSGIVLARGPDRDDRIRIVAPLGAVDAPLMDALAADIRAHLPGNDVPQAVGRAVPERVYVAPGEDVNYGFVESDDDRKWDERVRRATTKRKRH
jgi:hypothetical protein